MTHNPEDRFPQRLQPIPTTLNAKCLELADGVLEVRHHVDGRAHHDAAAVLIVRCRRDGDGREGVVRGVELADGVLVERHHARGGDGPSGPRMDDSDGMGCERSFTPFKTHPAALHLNSKHLTKVRDDS